MHSNSGVPGTPGNPGLPGTTGTSGNPGVSGNNPSGTYVLLIQYTRNYVNSFTAPQVPTVTTLAPTLAPTPAPTPISTVIRLMAPPSAPAQPALWFQVLSSVSLPSPFICCKQLHSLHIPDSPSFVPQRRRYLGMCCKQTVVFFASLNSRFFLAAVGVYNPSLFSFSFTRSHFDS